jgi:hypothetical protein
VDHLLGPNGIAYVAKVMPEKFAAIMKGPGHELGDFARLMGQGLTLVPFSAQLELTLPISAQLKLTFSHM